MPEEREVERPGSSDEELEQMAEVTLRDVKRAQGDYRQHAPAGRKGLLDAKEEDDGGR